MFGVIIVFISSFFDEISNSIVKTKLGSGQISLYSQAVLNNFTVTIIFIAVNIFNQEFAFSLASLPTISVRAILEISLTFITLSAISKADRSTYGFIRVLTMPLLLMVDFFLGYRFTIFQIAGIGVIVLSLFFIFSSHGLKKQGVWLSVASAVIAVATLSIYQYNITYYNSVTAEQTILHLVLLIFYFIMALFWAKENPFHFLKQKVFCFQSLITAFPSFLVSYAYIFAPASVILSAFRSSSVFWSVISGKFYFQEKHFLIKMICLILLIGGIILLAI